MSPKPVRLTSSFRKTQRGLGRSQLIIILGMITLVSLTAIIIPLPKLITYKQADIVSSSVYWRGFGEYGELMDTEAEFVKIDQGTQSLHICNAYGENLNCQEFKIIDSQGLVAVIWHALRL